MKDPIHVAVCTDEPVWAEGVRLSLQQPGSNLRVEIAVGAHESWLGWLTGLSQCEVGLLLWTPELTVEWLGELRVAAPQLRSVLWGPMMPVELAYQAAQTGVAGVLRRGVTVDDLRRCIDVVTANGTWFDRELVTQILHARTEALTRRETQLVALLAHGMKNKEIATELGIAEGTVKVYLSRLYEKLNVKDRFELALYGLKNQMPSGGSSASGRSRLLMPRTEPNSAPEQSLAAEKKGPATTPIAAGPFADGADQCRVTDSDLAVVLPEVS